MAVTPIEINLRTPIEMINLRWEIFGFEKHGTLCSLIDVTKLNTFDDMNDYLQERLLNLSKDFNIPYRSIQSIFWLKPQLEPFTHWEMASYEGAVRINLAVDENGNDFSMTFNKFLLVCDDDVKTALEYCLKVKCPYGTIRLLTE